MGRKQADSDRPDRKQKQGRDKEMAKLPAGMTKRSDGRIVNRFTIEGRRFSVYGSCVKECREKELVKRTEIEKGLLRTGKNYTVGDYIDQWLDAKTGTCKPATLRVNRGLLNRIKNTKIDATGTKFGQLKLTKVEPMHINQLQKALQTPLTMWIDGKPKTYKAQSSTSVNHSIHTLRTVFKAAVDEHILTWNPTNTTKTVKRTEPQAYNGIHRALSIEETALFLKTAEKMESWYLPLFIFLLNTGCRLGESGALMLSDITKDGIIVSRTLTRPEKGGYIIGEDAKTNAGQRFIPFTPESRKAIDEQRKKNTQLSGENVIEISKPIFRSPRGCFLEPSSINPIIADICDKAKIERFTCHCFRDTFATRCAESGMPPKTLMEIMGHTNIRMTYKYYVHTTNATKAEQLQAVNFM